jgi:hypothetical protein
LTLSPNPPRQRDESPRKKRLREPDGRDLFGHQPRDNNAEARRQAAIVAYVRLVAPHVLIWHVPNGGFRTKAEAARLKWTGVLAGVLDLTLALPDGRSAYWETKVPKTGRLSDDQKIVIAALERLGHSWSVVRSIDDARGELERLGVETREVYNG